MQVHVTPETAKELKDLPTTTASLNHDSFRMALELFQTGVDVMRQNLRRRHPEAHGEEIERLLGKWLRERPGAECGDCPGRPVDVNARLA